MLIEDNKEVLAWQGEQVKQLYDGLLLALILNLLLSLLLLVLMNHSISEGHAVVWLVSLILSLLARGIMYFRLQRKGHPHPARYWLNGYRVTALFTAAVWGAGALYLFPDDVTMQAYMAFVYAGISAAAMSTLSADRISAMGFLLFMLLPLMGSFLLVGSKTQQTMAVMITLFIFYMAAASARMLRNLRENFRLRTLEHEQNQALVSSEERFRNILDTCPTAARIARAGGHDVIFSNRQYHVLINRTRENVQGVDPAEYYVNRQDYEDILEKLGKGEEIFDKLVELKVPADGQEEIKWVLASYLPITYEGSKAVLGWFHDITERIRVERMKSEFVSVVSHELRTPLTAIAGAMGLIEGGVLGRIPQPMQEMLSMVNRNSQRLSLLINDLLDIEKLSAGKMTFEFRDENIVALVEQAVAMNQSYGSERKVGITVAGNLPQIVIHVDRQRFMQVMSNLLSNAIKFSPDQGNVEVGLSLVNGMACVEVKDKGQGIPEAFHGRIFEKFAQADSSDSRQIGGTGLGLAITRELVQAMGGEIGFTSHAGEGANFHFCFPVIGYAAGSEGATINHRMED